MLWGFLEARWESKEHGPNSIQAGAQKSTRLNQARCLHTWRYMGTNAGLCVVVKVVKVVPS